MLEEIIGAIESLQDPFDRAEMKISIAAHLNSLSQPTRALPYIEQTLREVSLVPVEERFRINSLKCKAAEQLARSGAKDRSLVMLSEALIQVDTFDETDERDYALIDVAGAYAEIGLYEGAIQVGTMIHDEFRRTWKLRNSIAHAVVENSAHDQVLEILVILENDDDREHFLLEVANMYFAKNQPERAIPVVSLMTDSSNRAQVLAKAVEHRSETTSPDQLLSLLAQAEAHAFLEQHLIMKGPNAGNDCISIY